MPEFDGLTSAGKFESFDVPILFLSARDDEIDRVLGSRSRRHYVTKPQVRELVARVNVLQRRIASRAGRKAPWPRFAQARRPDQHIAEFAGTLPHRH